MKSRRVTAFVESLRRNRRPKEFTPDPEEVEIMRAAIELNNAEPGAAIPRPEFVVISIAASRTSSMKPTHPRTSTRLAVSRRRVIGGISAAAAAAAAAAVAGAVVDRNLLNSEVLAVGPDSTGTGSRRRRLATGARRGESR